MSCSSTLLKTLCLASLVLLVFPKMQWQVPMSTTYSSIIKLNKTHYALFGEGKSGEYSISLNILLFDDNMTQLRHISIKEIKFFMYSAFIHTADNGYLLYRKTSGFAEDEWHGCLTKLDGNFAVTWELRMNDTISETRRSLIQDARGNIVLVAAREASRNGITVRKVNPQGVIIWTYKSNAGININHRSLAQSDGSEYVIAGYANYQIGSCISTVLRLTSSGHLDWAQELGHVCLGSVQKTADGGYVAFGSRIAGSSSQGVMVKMNAHGTAEWTRSLNSAASSVFYFGAQDAVTNSYFAAGHVFASSREYDILAHINAEGETSWQKLMQDEAQIIDCHKITEFDYITLVRPYSNSGDTHTQSLRRYTFNTSNSFSNCIDQCYVCGLGSYWNATRCVPCSFGCVECRDRSFCLRCSDRFMKTDDNKCAPLPTCDCSASNLTVECLRNCTTPTCSFARTTKYLMMGRRTCSCPAGLIDNGTHCLKTLDKGCPALCALCIEGVGACLRCRNGSSVVHVPVIGSMYKECSCARDHVLNGSDCVLSRRVVVPAKKEDMSLATIVFGVVAAIIAGISVAWAVYKRYTYWNSQSSVTIVSIAQNPISPTAVARHMTSELRESTNTSV